MLTRAAPAYTGSHVAWYTARAPRPMTWAIENNAGLCRPIRVVPSASGLLNNMWTSVRNVQGSGRARNLESPKFDSAYTHPFAAEQYHHR